MAVGERTPVAVLDGPAAGRLAIGEALTNIAAAHVGAIGRVKLSANWMCACGEQGEDAALYDTVSAVALDLCPRLGISIPVGKDSLSMRTAWQEPGGRKEVVAPLSLVRAVHEAFPHFERGAQQDAEEFLAAFFDALDAEAEAAGRRVTPPFASLATHATSTAVTCSACGAVSSREACASVLTLALPLPPPAASPSRARRSGGGCCGGGAAADATAAMPPLSLGNCLSAMAAPEVLEGANADACARCGGARDATRSTALSRLPRVLVVHLARHAFADGRAVKLAVRVDFPLSFEPRDALHDVATRDALAAAPRAYALRAVVEHRGRSARSGHYVAAVAGVDGASWSLQNDDHVGTPLSAAALQKLEPYMLFYEARD
jgi:uncharacterized UBP type Zn finger protein